MDNRNQSFTSFLVIAITCWWRHVLDRHISYVQRSTSVLFKPHLESVASTFPKQKIFSIHQFQQTSAADSRWQDLPGFWTENNNKNTPPPQKKKKQQTGAGAGPASKRGGSHPVRCDSMWSLPRKKCLQQLPVHNTGQAPSHIEKTSSALLSVQVFSYFLRGQQWLPLQSCKKYSSFCRMKVCEGTIGPVYSMRPWNKPDLSSKPKHRKQTRLNEFRLRFVKFPDTNGHKNEHDALGNRRVQKGMVFQRPRLVCCTCPHPNVTVLSLHPREPRVSRLGARRLLPGGDRGRVHDDQVVGEVVHERDALLAVHVQLVDEAKPVDDQPRSEPAETWTNTEFNKGALTHVDTENFVCEQR